MNEAEKLAQWASSVAAEQELIHLISWVELRNGLRQSSALITRQAEQIKDLRRALNALYVAAPISLECHSFHHSKGEQHSHTQECKPKSAYLEALAASAAALAATKEET